MTTLSDAFTYSNGTLPDPPWGVTGLSGSQLPSVVSNHVEAPGLSVLYYVCHDTACATQAQYAQVLATPGGTSNYNELSVVVRATTANASAYQFSLVVQGGAYRYDLYRNNADGSFDLLDTAAASAGAKTIRLEANGSSIKGFANGVEVVSATDSAITGTRVGFGFYEESSPSGQIDDFAGGDLSAGPVTLTLTPALVTANALAPALAGTGAASHALATATATSSARPPTLAGSGAATLAPAPAAASLAAQSTQLVGTGAVALSLAPTATTALAVPAGLLGAGTAQLSPAAAVASMAGVPVQLAGSGAASLSLVAALATVSAVVVQLDSEAGDLVLLVTVPAVVTASALSVELLGAGAAALVLGTGAVSVSAEPAQLAGVDTAQLALTPVTAQLSARTMSLAGDVATLALVSAIVDAVAVALVLADQARTFPAGAITGSVTRATITGSVVVIGSSGSVVGAQIGE